MKIRLVGAELFCAGGRAGGRTDGRTDGRMDLTKLIVTFCNFPNAPKMETCSLFSCSEFFFLFIYLPMFIVWTERAIIKPGTLPLIQEGIRLCGVCYMIALYLRSLYRIGEFLVNEYEVLTGNPCPGATASPCGLAWNWGAFAMRCRQLTLWAQSMCHRDIPFSMLIIEQFWCSFKVSRRWRRCLRLKCS